MERIIVETFADIEKEFIKRVAHIGIRCAGRHQMNENGELCVD